MALDYKSSLSRYRRYLQLVQSQPLWNASMWVILSLILLILLVLMALKPTLVTISGLLGEIQQKKETSQQLDQKILQVRNALNAMDSVKEDIPMLDQALPNDPGWDSLAQDLYDIASGSGLLITSISIDRVPVTQKDLADLQAKSSGMSLIPQGVAPIRFVLSANGDYQSIQDALGKIEKIKRLLVFSGVDIQQNKNGQLTLTLTGEAGFILEQNKI